MKVESFARRLAETTLMQLQGMEAPQNFGEDEGVPLDLEASYVTACELLRIR